MGTNPPFGFRLVHQVVRMLGLFDVHWSLYIHAFSFCDEILGQNLTMPTFSDWFSWLENVPGLMDMHGNVVFRIHYNGVFQYDPLRYEQCRVTKMQACTIDRIMFSQLLDMLVAKVKDNIWALFICIPDLDIDSSGLKLIESVADVHALSDLAKKFAIAEEEARSLYLRSPPFKSRPFRNDIKGRVLFTHMYCAEDEGFEMTPPLNDDEVGKEDLLLYASDLEIDCVNDAVNTQFSSFFKEWKGMGKCKILEGMSAGKNDASKYVEYTQGVTDGMNEGIHEGMNDGMNEGMNEGMNGGINEGMNEGINEGMDTANNDLDEQVLSRQKKLNKGKSIMTPDDIAISKKRKVTSRGNGISIRENDGQNVVLTDSETDAVPDEFPFDEVPRTTGDEGTSTQGQHTYVDVDMFGEIDYTGVGLTPLIRDHEKYIQALLGKLMGNGLRITYPFSIVEESKETYLIYDDLTHWKLKKPKLGEKFLTVDKFKECLTYYALENGFSLFFKRSNKEKIVAKCGQRKEVIKDLRRHFGDKIRMNPQITLNQIARLVKKKYKCIVSRTQCRNAKNFALNEGEVTIQDHYSYLGSYAKALADSNDDSIVKVGVTVNPDEKTYFDRFYVCFKVLKDGWKIGSGYHQKDRKPSQNDKTEHGMEKTVQNQGQSPKMSKSESILKNQQSKRL
ncbi:hypothetical protein Tco_0562751 [Tanacetum coccineum]